MKRAVHHSAVWLVLPLWLLFVGISLGRVALLVYYNHNFTANMRQVEGTVQKKWDVLVDHFSGARVYLLVYAYDAGDVHAQVRTGVDKETYDRVRTGGPVPIAYLPSDPRISCIDYPWELSDRAWLPLDDFVIAMAAFVPGVFLIGHFARRNRIYQQLKTAGVHTLGEVTAVGKSHYRAHSDTYLVFQFSTPAGHVITGRSPSVTSADRTLWNVGDPVSILYDPKNPSYFSADVRHPLDGLIEEESTPRTHENLFA